MSPSSPLPNTIPTTLQCIPDEYLTKTHLDALLDDFNTGIAASLPTTSLFYHLVNGVRQAYLSRIRNPQQPEETQDERFEKCVPQITSPPASSHEVLRMPANTDILHIGGAISPRRDLVHWANWDISTTWTRRFDIKVFKFLEVGTVRIRTGHMVTPSRMYACLGNENLPGGWTWRLDFYAFRKWRPGTEMISVGRAKDCDPDRCVFVRGEHAGKLEGWEEIFVFWVPI